MPSLSKCPPPVYTAGVAATLLSNPRRCNETFTALWHTSPQTGRILQLRAGEGSHVYVCWELEEANDQGVQSMQS